MELYAKPTDTLIMTSLKVDEVNKMACGECRFAKENNPKKKAKVLFWLCVAQMVYFGLFSLFFFTPTILGLPSCNNDINNVWEAYFSKQNITQLCYLDEKTECICTYNCFKAVFYRMEIFVGFPSSCILFLGLQQKKRMMLLVYLLLMWIGAAFSFFPAVVTVLRYLDIKAIYVIVPYVFLMKFTSLVHNHYMYLLHKCVEECECICHDEPFVQEDEAVIAPLK